MRLHIITGAGFEAWCALMTESYMIRLNYWRGWGRSSAVFDESRGIKKRFNTKVDGIPYDGKYIFKDMGYNFLPSEISAAFATEQLRKITQEY